MPDGQLLIGLRAPLYKDKALAIPLLNPAEVVEGKPAKFGPAKELALGYRGIRDIAFFQGTYYILATGEKHLDPPQLFTWTGGDAEPVKAKGAHLHHLNPEGLVIFPDLEGRRILVLSDDGQASKAKTRNFRAVWLDRLPEKP